MCQNIIEEWIDESHPFFYLSKEKIQKLCDEVEKNTVQDCVLYRGVSKKDYEDYKSRLTSWTFDKSVAENFSDDGIVLVYDVKKPIKALDISDINTYEKEVIVGEGEIIYECCNVVFSQ